MGDEKNKSVFHISALGLVGRLAVRSTVPDLRRNIISGTNDSALFRESDSKDKSRPDHVFEGRSAFRRAALLD